MDIKEMAVGLKGQGFSYHQIAKKIEEETGEPRSDEAIRSMFRRIKNQALQEEDAEVPILPANGVKSITVNIKTDKHKIPVWLAFDIHKGDKVHLSKLFKLYCEYAKEKEARILIGGDAFSSASPSGHHPQAVFEQILTPQEQLDALYEIFYPLRKQIDGVIEGNHEEWIYEKTSLQMGRLLAQRLKVPHLDNGAFITYKINKQKYTMYLHHGNKALKSDKEFEDARLDYGNPDAMCFGHDHRVWSKRNAYFDLGKEKEIHYVRGGSFLGNARYAQRAKRGTTAKGSAILFLYSQHNVFAPNTSNFVKHEFLWRNK